jgi:hypothetical protein
MAFVGQGPESAVSGKHFAALMVRQVSEMTEMTEMLTFFVPPPLKRIEKIVRAYDL